MISSLEDFHEDILSKAMRGLAIGKNEMAQRLGVEKHEIGAILRGDVDENLIHAMAGELKLDGPVNLFVPLKRNVLIYLLKFRA